MAIDPTIYLTYDDSSTSDLPVKAGHDRYFFLYEVHVAGEYIDVLPGKNHIDVLLNQPVTGSDIIENIENEICSFVQSQSKGELKGVDISVTVISWQKYEW